MSTDVESDQQTLEFEGGDSFEEFGGPEAVFGTADFDDERPLRPIDWNTLTADEALVEWEDLDKFVKWLRLSYGLPPAVVPPLWHRHDELIWELSALHTARVNAYDPEASPVGSAGVASRIPRVPATAPRVGVAQRHPAGPRPADEADRVARRTAVRACSRGRDRRPRRRLRGVRGRGHRRTSSDRGRTRVRLVVARLAVHICSLHPVVHSHATSCSAYPPAGSTVKGTPLLERTPPCCSPTR